MSIKDQLVGLKYPVQNTDGLVVGFKKIKAVQSVENSPAFAISLNNGDSVIMVNFLRAIELVDQNTNGTFDALSELA